MQHVSIVLVLMTVIVEMDTREMATLAQILTNAWTNPLIVTQMQTV